MPKKKISFFGVRGEEEKGDLKALLEIWRK
jgi:hypothetical protein